MDPAHAPRRLCSQARGRGEGGEPGTTCGRRRCPPTTGHRPRNPEGLSGVQVREVAGGPSGEPAGSVPSPAAKDLPSPPRGGHSRGGGCRPRVAAPQAAGPRPPPRCPSEAQGGRVLISPERGRSSEALGLAAQTSGGSEMFCDTSRAGGRSPGSRQKPPAPPSPAVLQDGAPCDYKQHSLGDKTRHENVQGGKKNPSDNVDGDEVTDPFREFICPRGEGFGLKLSVLGTNTWRFLPPVT